MIKTVKDLKKVLENLPEDMSIQVYDGYDEKPISYTWTCKCKDKKCPKCNGTGGCWIPYFIISTD